MCEVYGMYEYNRTRAIWADVAVRACGQWLTGGGRVRTVADRRGARADSG